MRTRVRLSYGESLRFASIAERYVEGTLTDGINIRGNLDLQNESGNNWEVGLVHEIKSGDQAWVLDASAFVLNYDDMIEYTLQAETDSMGSIVIVDGVPQFFFQPLNLGKTRIAGVEGSVAGQGRWVVCLFVWSPGGRSTMPETWSTTQPKTACTSSFKTWSRAWAVQGTALWLRDPC